MGLVAPGAGFRRDPRVIIGCMPALWAFGSAAPRYADGRSDGSADGQHQPTCELDVLGFGRR